MNELAAVVVREHISCGKLAPKLKTKVHHTKENIIISQSVWSVRGWGVEEPGHWEHKYH